jgi:hypothetical protein
VSVAAEIAAFVAATAVCALTLALTWALYRALAPSMDRWAHVAVAVGVLLPVALAGAGADDGLAIPVILGYTLTLAGFSITRALRGRPPG